MAKCIFSHCENEGGRIEIGFTPEDSTQKHWANVSMCMDCWKRLREHKVQGLTNTCNVLWSKPTGHWLDVDFDYLKKRANVQKMQFKNLQA